MERLARLAHRIVWVNPRASAAGFVPRVGGMVAALPHIDALVSGHSLEALHEVADAIAGADIGVEVPEEEEETWAERDTGRGQLGGDAERVRPEPGEDDGGMVKTCIYPGCERPAVPPHPLGGPQPAFCDREDHNALSAHLKTKGARTWLTRPTARSFCASTRRARWC